MRDLFFLQVICAEVLEVGAGTGQAVEGTDLPTILSTTP